jgi:hypothetical protein
MRRAIALTYLGSAHRMTAAGIWHMARSARRTARGAKPYAPASSSRSLTCQVKDGCPLFTAMAVRAGFTTITLLPFGPQAGRVVIEQAKGFLAERWKVTPDEAFGSLRRQARTNQQALAHLARAIITGTADLARPDPVQRRGRQRRPATTVNP